MSKASRWLLVLCVWIAACGDDTNDPDGMSGSGAAAGSAGSSGGGAGGASGNAGTSAGDGGASGQAGTGGAGGSGGDGGSAGTNAGTGGVGGISGDGGDGGDGGTSGDAGMSGDAGDAGMGGDAGDSGASGGATTYDPADRCDPGTYIAAEQFAFSSQPDHASVCNDANHVAAGEAGVFEGTPQVRVFVRNIALSTPMVAGEPYAMSFEIDFEGVDGAMAVELWGTTAHCGMGTTATMFFEAVLTTNKQTVCADVTPTEAYSHVLLVLRDQDDVPPDDMQTVLLDGATFCAEGACP